MNQFRSIRLLLAAFCFSLAGWANAADFYIAQTATGDGSGRNAQNCKPYTFFTTASNWNGAAGTTICAATTKDTVRDTIHLVGVIQNQLLWPYATGTGSAGLVIYFEPGAKLSAPTWPSGAINWQSAAYSKHRVTIDGGVNGIIECTANGSNLANKTPNCSAIAFSSANYVTIQNLTISNIYVRTDPNDQVDGGSGIYASTSGGAYTDFTVRDCNIHDVNIGINAPYTRGSARYSFIRNNIYNINWGIGTGSASTDATMDDWLAEGNVIHSFSKWDAPIGLEAFHHNGIFLWGSNGTNNFRSAIIRNNTFGPGFGTRATSGVYLSSYGMRGTYLVYNNLFIGSCSNGLLNIGTGDSSVVRAYNNTFACNSPSNGCIQVGGISAPTNMTVHVRNNIASGGVFLNGNNIGSVTLYSDHNLAYGFSQNFPGVISWSPTGNGKAIAWSDWKSIYLQDRNSIYARDPLLDGSLRLQAGSPGIAAGYPLPEFFSKDFSMSDRVTPWDIGAFRYSPLSAPADPSEPKLTPGS